MEMLPTCMIRQEEKLMQSREFFHVYTKQKNLTTNEYLFYVSIWLLSISLDEPQQNAQ